MRIRFPFVLLLSACAVLWSGGSGRAFDVVLNAQGEFLDAYLMNGSAPPSRVVFIDPDRPEPDRPGGRRPATGYEVALAAFAIDPENRFQVMAATWETLAHLELLRREGRALRSEVNGVVHYQGR